MIQLPTLFSDHMVLQRERKNPIWGRATANCEVVVKFLNETITTHSDGEGNWKCELPSAEAGGPHEIHITCAEDKHTIVDVLVGEVWLGSGQSNMYWQVQQSDGHEEELAGLDDPELRTYQVELTASRSPEWDVPAKWHRAHAETAGIFSAVGYYFAKELRKKLKVPIGFLHASWGGSSAEAWVSLDMLKSSPTFSEKVRTVESMSENDHERDREEYLEKLRVWKDENVPKDPGNRGLELGWHEETFDDSSWTVMPMPSYWQTHHVFLNGSLWFRYAFDLPESWQGKELQLNLSAMDKGDWTYFNGSEVGSLMTNEENPDVWDTPRVYTIPANLVKGGRNTLAIRIFSFQFSGGMNGNPEQMRISLKDNPEESISVAGDWKYQIEHDLGIAPIEAPFPAPLSERPNHFPGALFNGMIQPLIDYGFHGALWYQGETNASMADQYEELLNLLISDWRTRFDREFPFIVIQLPNYLAKQRDPEETGNWAMMRHAQRQILKTPNTGIVITIDLGEAGDIHPTNKRDVGYRAALWALHHQYGFEDIRASGPLPNSVTCDKDTVEIEFHHASNLEFKDPEEIGFCLCDRDGTYHWAKAEIVEGNRVRLSCPEVKEPVKVLYAWADNPIGSLVNEVGLPASPFREIISR